MIEKSRKEVTKEIKEDLGATAYVKNCIMVGRAGDQLRFYVTKDDHIYTFDGYAIIPREEYDRLLEVEFRMKGLEK